MTSNVLERLFEHNNWANQQMIEACSVLSDEQLDAEPVSATKGTIRITLTHLVTSQRGYLALLTMPAQSRPKEPPKFADLEASARSSGEALLAIARDGTGSAPDSQLQTTNGYLVDPWVVMVQVINHATEHREQISSMLTALGITPPDLDGWTYGLAAGALKPL